MQNKLRNLLNGKMENHLMPFFWQHGEDENTLRHYMKVIDECGCKAVCVESRPHPDFCGEKWWNDMDVILDEACKRGMKVWILDDSHFPTGFANGAVRNAPLKLHRQSICANRIEAGEEELNIKIGEMIPPKFQPIGVEQYILESVLATQPHYDDDEIVTVTAVNHETDEHICLDSQITDGLLKWKKPEGKWAVWVIGLSRNCGPHRDYINMLDEQSVKILLDTVYEPHYQHYAEYFGNTIAGFFSDEPELGNGHLYYYQNYLGTDQDLPFSMEIVDELKKYLGEDWKSLMHYLWDNDCEPNETARIRYLYMDIITKMVRESFSRQIGSWCREHGVQYIGHMIEDDNAHARTGSGLGHYFRGLAGQDMSGIDDIGGQVLPQGEEEPVTGNLMIARDGEFYHFMLGALGASAASIDPGKHGNAMCEIFGNYGWNEGVHLEKYLADHFMVRGINNFVPHAFSAAPFPDPDCPPHFYAHGHNPQYRHFGELMKYMNRVCTLISDGSRIAQVAVLYHGESEWSGKAMLSQKPARRLVEAQIAFDCIPADVFAETEYYRSDFSNGLKVNGRSYQALVIPEADYITEETAQKIGILQQVGFPVYFLEKYPIGICNGRNEKLQRIQGYPIVSLENLVSVLNEKEIPEIVVTPANRYLRALHYYKEQHLYYFVNEGTETFEGTIRVPTKGDCFQYDAWNNCCLEIKAENMQVYTNLHLKIEPLKSVIVVFGEAPEKVKAQLHEEGNILPLGKWVRSQCAGIDHPAFQKKTIVEIPDHMELEQPAFSGFVRYETTFSLPQKGKTILKIANASEGVEVFVNEKSLGIQIAPPYVYDLTEFVKKGTNILTIEVATTLERCCYEYSKANPYAEIMGVKEPKCGTGLTGEVKVILI